MIKTRLTTIKQEEETALVCDRCRQQYSKDEFGYHEFLRLDFVADYASAFGDGKRVQCEICSACLKELVLAYCRISEPE